MYKCALILVGLACPVHARSSQTARKLSHGEDRSLENQEKEASEYKTDALASLLLAVNPTFSRNARPSAAQQSRTKSPRMPIGVPKVPYKEPGAQNANWIDLYNKLYRERVLFLGGQVDDEIANQLIAIMLYLDSEDKNKPISIYINSPGGSVTAGLAIYDTMRHISCDVITINVGLAASMGSLLLAAGTKGKRLSLPHARVMIHQPAVGGRGIGGQAEDIKIEAQEIIATKERFIDDYAALTGQDRETIRRDIARDNFMSAQEAKDYGLIDQIIETTPKY
mmetsp:Transcript_86199/g.136065  ORF Transcript_86199/g.136065 Transcript_86199/m.136065 type:complete len:281 (-) Transcript_86199:76-918(-)